MRHFPLLTDSAGREIVAVAHRRHLLRARVLLADHMPRIVAGEYTGADYAPTNVALGFGIFLWSWPLLQHLPCRVRPLYRRQRTWNPFAPDFLKAGVWRQAKGWSLLRGQICFAHLLSPFGEPVIELPKVGSILELDAWSCDVVALGEGGFSATLVHGYHGPQPSRRCPWLLPERLEVLK